MKSDGQPMVSVLVVVRNGASVLMIKRVGLYKGYWAIPGGKLKFGEDLEEGALREIEEETGLRVRLTGLKDIFTEVANLEGGIQHHFIFFVFTALSPSRATRSSEEGETRWFGLNGIERVRVIPSDLAILREVLQENGSIVLKRIVMDGDSEGRLTLRHFDNFKTSQ